MGRTGYRVACWKRESVAHRYSNGMPLQEKSLIKRIRLRARGGSAVVTGIGDDCAVLRLPPGHELLVTTDFTIEKVHFRRDWHRPDVVGWRCLARGLSDIAAMGGQPRAAFLSLALASDVPQKWVDRFFTGLLSLADEFKVPLAGGDTAESPLGIQADIVVVGSVPHGKAVLRSGARPADRIYVTGELGGSAAAIARLAAEQPMGPRAGALFRPKPRLAAGEWLRRQGLPSAMIDVSDGLSTDLEHLCQESHVGAEIEAGAIPLPRVGRRKPEMALELALHGGDDYELLFTSSKDVPSRVAGVRVTRIGRITQASGMRLLDAEGRPRKLEARGWEHFRGNS
jgi:thiamine-monophosphate kinase